MRKLAEEELEKIRSINKTLYERCDFVGAEQADIFLLLDHISVIEKERDGLRSIVGTLASYSDGYGQKEYEADFTILMPLGLSLRARAALKQEESDV